MMKIVLYGWNEGLQKISLTNLQRDLLGIPLAQAKENVDSLLEDKIIVLYTENKDLAEEFILQARAVRVICRMEY